MCVCVCVFTHIKLHGFDNNHVSHPLPGEPQFFDPDEEFATSSSDLTLQFSVRVHEINVTSCWLRRYSTGQRPITTQSFITHQEDIDCIGYVCVYVCVCVCVCCLLYTSDAADDC